MFLTYDLNSKNLCVRNSVNNRVCVTMFIQKFEQSLNLLKTFLEMYISKNKKKKRNFFEMFSFFA